MIKITFDKIVDVKGIVALLTFYEMDFMALDKLGIFISLC